MEKTLHSESYGTLRNWLRTNRESRNLTMRVLAARMGVSHSWIAKVEKGERRLDVIEFVNLCFALGLNPHTGLDLLITASSPYMGSRREYPRAAGSAAPYGRKQHRS